MSGFSTTPFLHALPWAVGAVVLAATFIASKIAHKHSVIDTAWGLLFTSIAVAVFIRSAGHGDPVRRWLLLILPVLWGVRLALHIGRRTVGQPEDPRYADLLAKARGNPDLYALRMVYLLQGILALVISAPILVGAFECGPVWGLAWVGRALVWRPDRDRTGDHDVAADQGLRCPDPREAHVQPRRLGRVRETHQRLFPAPAQEGAMTQAV